MLFTQTNSTTNITTVCPVCGKTRFVLVNIQGYRAWCSGTLIQDALPDLNKSEREALITGFCDACWEEMGDGE